MIGFTALIPVLGAFIGCVVGIVLILTVNPIQAVVFVILFLVLQQLEEQFVYLHIVGNSVGLPAIWVMVAVIVGGGLMGIIGMLIFIPLVSVLYNLLDVPQNGGEKRGKWRRECRRKRRCGIQAESRE